MKGGLNFTEYLQLILCSTVMGEKVDVQWKRALFN